MNITGKVTGALIISGILFFGTPAANGSNPTSDSRTATTQKTDLAQSSSEYLRLSRSYADAMIAHGRDCYGDVHTPLFAAALSRETLQLGSKDEFGSIQGVRENDRSLGGANPWDHMALYPLLFHLSKYLGDPVYDEKANLALEYFFNHTQSPETGLLAWGDHLYWDFRNNRAGGYRYHEIAGAWPFWDTKNIR